MGIAYQYTPSPVSGMSLDLAQLQAFHTETHDNIRKLDSAIDSILDRQYDLTRTNQQLVKFMNWIAVTNPQILDEFQATANAFDKLSPREQGDELAYATAQGL
jgi:sensor domain CHASE-containing protein